MRVFTRRKVFLPLLAAVVALGITAAVALANTTLVSHTGEVGATWTEHASYTAGEATVVTADGTLRANVANQRTVDYASGAPTNANYKVEADVIQKSPTTGANAGVAGRIATGADTYYFCRYVFDNLGWGLYKQVAGVTTQLGSTASETLTDNVANHVVLSMNGTTISCTQDGNSVASVTDSSITAAGKAGVYLRANTSVDDTHNYFLDNFTATDL